MSQTSWTSRTQWIIPIGVLAGVAYILSWPAPTSPEPSSAAAPSPAPILRPERATEIVRLEGLLASKHAATRRQAVRELGERKGTEPVQVLALLIKRESEPQIRADAAIAMRRASLSYDERSAAKHLTAHFKREPELLPRMAVLQALELYPGSPEIDRPLVAQLAKAARTKAERDQTKKLQARLEQAAAAAAAQASKEAKARSASHSSQDAD